MEFDDEEIIDEEEEIEEETFEEVYENLDEDDKQELEYLGEQLDKIHIDEGGLQTVVTDKNLKKRIAKICLKLIEKTPMDADEMMKTAYVITGSFVWVTYEDKLDEVMSIAGELELPEELITDNPKELWMEMKDILTKYIDT